MANNNFFDKIYGCLAGLAIGDALGMPTEGLTPNEIQQIFGYVTTFKRAPDGHPNSFLPEGHITDDTEETIVLIDAIIENKGIITPESFSEKLIDWAKKGLDKKPYVGPSTRKAIENILNGVPIELAGERNVTCGAAMRIAPIGLLYPGKPEVAAKKAAEISRVTHGGKPAIAAASAVAAAISISLSENASLGKIIDAAINGAKIGADYGRDVVSPSVEKRIRLSVDIAKKFNDPKKATREIYEIIGTGIHSAEAIPAAFGILIIAKGNPMDAIILSTNIGGDTDTIGAISGAIAGAFRGISKIDKQKLKIVEEVNKIGLENYARKLTNLMNYDR
ncbi:MAG: ADP-ribosylglycohydrolase family protein [Candidatus Odinarchaeota archaeon]|nr:ADP-ribosylglycohydrolase family protein [Candidatus Odinarchaeota archaeon]